MTITGQELLADIAKKALWEKGFQSRFSEAVNMQLATIQTAAPYEPVTMRDKRSLLWCSIDNDDSKDLDQLTVAYSHTDGGYILAIAVADVDSLVKKSTPIDLHAQINTTSIYTPAKIFPMLPEKLSTDLTSLNEECDRAAIIFELVLNDKMEVVETDVYLAVVRNRAQLTYSGVGAWIEGRGAIPDKVVAISGLEEALLLQDQIAQAFKRRRESHGALTFDTIELKAAFENSEVVELFPFQRNRAHELIENLMIAANTTSAHYSLNNNLPSLRRVVRVPQRWERIVALAASLDEILPEQPDSKALDAFLRRRKEIDPETFPDLSLAVIKLLGSGEYVVEVPGDPPIGHFGLALRDYTHSTAPNRRYPDLITQRLIKASLHKEKVPYTVSELETFAKHCTQCEDAASKVERRLKKCAAAMLLQDRIGETFDALVTGASDKGIWVRLHTVPVEGKLMKAYDVDVGDKIRVKLTNVNVVEGFIDFVRV